MKGEKLIYMGSEVSSEFSDKQQLEARKRAATALIGADTFIVITCKKGATTGGMDIAAYIDGETAAEMVSATQYMTTEVISAVIKASLGKKNGDG